MTINEAKLEEFVGKVVTDLAAAEAGAVAYLGDRLGFYSLLAGAGPITADSLARKAGTNERLTREWLANQVAGGYVEYDANADTFELPDEHAAVLAEETSAVYVAGVLEIAAAMWADAGKVEAAFRSDGGVSWGDHDERLYSGVERLFGPLYRSQLTTAWIPALTGVEAKLTQGGRVADVGCGHGISTVIMAEAYPNSEFVGFDSHPASIEAAGKRAAEAGVTDRVRFDVADAHGAATGETGFDLVCFLDCLHDMGDPVAAAAAARSILNEGGSVLVVEPKAADALTDNVNPVSRLYYSGSTFLCTPSSLAQTGAAGLGAQAGPTVLTRVLRDAGFATAQVVAETPFNTIIEARG